MSEQTRVNKPRLLDLFCGAGGWPNNKEEK